MPVRETREAVSDTVQKTAASMVETAEGKLLDFLANLRNLETDWDGEGALKPDEGAIDDSISLSRNLFSSYPDTKIEQACAGAVGEIVIELRNDGKSVEFIFYPNKKWKYVSVGGKKQPEQGIFEMSNLPKLITWLNDKA